MREKILEILKRELVPAEGCTEPIVVAYAVSLAAEYLEEEVTYIEASLSGNIIKNALGVGIPGTGMAGLDISIALGATIKKSYKKLEILSNFSKEELEKAKEMLTKNIIKIIQNPTEEKLHIDILLEGKENTVRVIISKDHTNVIYIERNGEILKDLKQESCDDRVEENIKLSIETIYEFSTMVDFESIKFLLESAKMNSKVSEEGLKGGYGLEVGSKIIKEDSFNILTNNIANRIIAATAAASDARMDGCTLPIMTTAGSGNQGIACSMPVIELSKILEKTEEELAIALAISNLITIHLKSFMGRLSPLCGAGIAGATGASCGMTYLLGGKLQNLKHAVNNMIADVAGMICDGAKTTCALKIATSTNAAIQCATLAMNNISPTSKEGIIFEDVEQTIENIERLIKEGLKNIDKTILDIMLAKC